MSAKSARDSSVLRDSSTARSIRSSTLVSSLFIFGFALSACGGRSAGTSGDAQNAANRLTQLKCGNTTYNLSTDKRDTEVNEACDRLNKSYKSHQSIRDRVRFTCQDAKGHTVESALVPVALLSDYDKSCQEYMAADQPFQNGAADRQVHFDALKRFQSETNQLTRQTVDEANVVWRQSRADQSALNKLIKIRGGSIVITD
jgi:hypothetical protein